MRENDSTARLVGTDTPCSSPPTTIDVVLADDHRTMRRSLLALLDGERDIRVVAEAGDAAAAVRAVREHAPRVLVLDMHLSLGHASELQAAGFATSGPAGSDAGLALEIATHVRSRMPGTEVVVTTMQESTAFVPMAMEAGAIGFVRKDRGEIELADAVRAASRGELFISLLLTGH